MITRQFGFFYSIMSSLLFMTFPKFLANEYFLIGWLVVSLTLIYLIFGHKKKQEKSM